MLSVVVLKYYLEVVILPLLTSLAWKWLQICIY